LRCNWIGDLFYIIVSWPVPYQTRFDSCRQFFLILIWLIFTHFYPGYFAYSLSEPVSEQVNAIIYNITCVLHFQLSYRAMFS